MFDNIAQLQFITTSPITHQSEEEQSPKTPPPQQPLLSLSKGVVAVGMVSGEGEEMAFKKMVVVEGRVERWMGEVEKEMKHSNRRITKEAVFYYCANNDTRLEFYLNYWKQIFIIYK